MFATHLTLRRLGVGVRVEPLSLLQHSIRRISNEYHEGEVGVVSQGDNRTFSGIQPTGTLHLGNYLGAVKRWSEQLSVENRMNKFYCIVDLHAITMPQPPEKLRAGILEMTASLIACGLSPEKCVLFQQSTVKEHTELCWILGTLCTMSRLYHLTQYKDKAEKLQETPLGLFLYPVLQSADILLYKAADVPVGEDNLQNIQIAKYLCSRFNSTYGDFFPYPNAILPDDNTARVRSLRNPLKKMSKSDLDQRACIFINDSPDQLRDKVKRSVTDSMKEITYDPENRPGVANLILIYSSLTNLSVEEVQQHIYKDNINKVMLKDMVTTALVDHLTPIREEMDRLLADRGYLDTVLDQGRSSAHMIAQQTLIDVKRLVGFT